MMEKSHVNGEDANIAYRYLRVHSDLDGAPITWNFAKFLLDADGKVLKHYPPHTDPNEILPDILSHMRVPLAMK